MSSEKINTFLIYNRRCGNTTNTLNGISDECVVLVGYDRKHIEHLRGKKTKTISYDDVVGIPEIWRGRKTTFVVDGTFLNRTVEENLKLEAEKLKEISELKHIIDRLTEDKIDLNKHIEELIDENANLRKMFITFIGFFVFVVSFAIYYAIYH